ncbi:MAG: LysR family transcriptional regulator [Polyangiaceae bacterium]
MDRLDAMEAFVVTMDRGSLSKAARALGRSVTGISRAITSLEARLGVELVRRSTRALQITEAGDRYLGTCRRVLAELSDAEEAATSERASPQGTLTVTAPVMFGALHVRPAVDAYLARYTEVRARLLLLDRIVNVVDEGVDVAVRIAHMPDSALFAVPVGRVRRVVVASPKYLAGRGRPRTPKDLSSHRCISFGAATPTDSWSFGPGPRGGRARQVKITPFLSVNTAEAALGSAIDGHGVVSVLSYQAARALEAGTLVRVLTSFEGEPLPVQLVHPAKSAGSAKLRAFMDLAVPLLRTALMEPAAPPSRSEPGKRRAR